VGEEDQGQDQNGHPAWQEILDVLPEELRPLITPKLQEWDQGVNNRFAEIHSKYDPYKDIVENQIDPEFLEGTIGLAQQIQDNPAEVVQNMIDHFNLEQFKQQAQQQTSDSEFVDLNSSYDVDDLRKDPRLAPLFEQQEKFQEWMQEQEEDAEAEEEEEELEEYMNELHEAYGDFDDTYVLAMLANDIDGEVAVKQFQDTVNQAAQTLAGVNQNQQQKPPVVMGAGGTTGSGIPQSNVKMGDLKDQDVNSMVTSLLRQAAQEKANTGND